MLPSSDTVLTQSAPIGLDHQATTPCHQDVVKAMEAASQRAIPYRIAPRRPGDAAITVANPALAAQQLHWRTQRSLADICRDGWAWQQANPNGYGKGCR